MIEENKTDRLRFIVGGEMVRRENIDVQKMRGVTFWFTYYHIL
jgi:hypothetical protein